MMNSTDITLSVNTTRLVQALKFSFTERYTVISELMQNARRAQASAVTFCFDADYSTLTVSDDGIGIDSLSTLLTLAESGWEADVMANEHPFGIGFLSALYACQRIEVVSNSGQFAASTDDIINFRPITILPVEHWDGNTVITLQGVDFTHDGIEDKLSQCAQGFPIPVVWNGLALSRPDALDGGKTFVLSDLGWLYLAGLEDTASTCVDFTVFLQGLPIYRSYASMFLRQYHVVHLDSQQFAARLPDRDKLINEAEAVTSIKATLRKALARHFLALKTQVDPAQFVSHYPMLNAWSLLALLNDVPVVPPNLLKTVASAPHCSEWVYGEFLSSNPLPLTLAELDLQGVVSLDEDITEQGAAGHVWALVKRYWLYVGGLDSLHWLLTRVKPLCQPSVQVIAETATVLFQGEWLWVNVCFCTAYQLSIAEDTVIIENQALYLGQAQGNTLIMPRLADPEQALCQVSDYQDEYDCFQQSLYEVDQTAFSAFCVANSSDDPVSGMRQLLPSVLPCPLLYGKCFKIDVDEHGQLTVYPVMA